MKIKTIDKIKHELHSSQKLKSIGKAVSIFGGARAEPDSHAYEAATEIAYQLGINNISVITGGGPGIMEAANLGAKKAKSDSVGLVISLPFEAVDNEYIDEEYNLKFDYFFPRKVAFVSNSDAFVIMPGGFGTLDELFEVLTLIQCKKIGRVPIALFDSNFWAPMLKMLDVMATNGTISRPDLKLFEVFDDPYELVNFIKRGI